MPGLTIRPPLPPILIALMLSSLLSGCGGCQSDSSNEKGTRKKTSMAGQPEEYLDPSRLDAKEDSTLIAADSQFRANAARLDSFVLAVDSNLLPNPDDTTGAAPVPASGHSGR